MFVGAGTLLAQNNFGFFYDAATNTLKSRNQTNSDSGSFGIGTGDVGGSSTGGSGALTIETGDGSPNSSGTDAAGNSGAVTVATGAGGNGDNGSLSGNSGDLNLKTGSGGGNDFSGFSGGSAGNIILQPGSGGSGPAGQGVGGSTLVRASNSGDILAVQNSAGTTTHLGVANNGNVRIGTASSAARLQLGAGTANLPPLKLTAGTNLTSPAAGAIEFDGTDLFITNSSNRRRYLTSDSANVLDFGAKGDGSTDDSAAFQAAVNSLIETGGLVWVPPNRKYVVGNVTIKARYQVWITSGMYGHFLGGNAGTTQNEKASITPKTGAGTTHIFKWERHAALTSNGFGAGGGVSGLVIGEAGHELNFVSDGVNGYRVTAIGTGAIWVNDADQFMICECTFQWLKGTAIRVEQSTFCQIENCQLDQCGDSGKPVIDVGGGVTQGYCWVRRCFSQGHHSGAVRLGTNAAWVEHAGYYELDAAGNVPVIDATLGSLKLNDTFISAEGDAHTIIVGQPDGIIDGCEITSTPGANSVIKIEGTANSARISNCRLYPLGQTGPLIDIGAPYCQLTNLYCQGGGQIKFTTGWFGQINGLYWYAPGAAQGQYAIDLSNGGMAWYNNATNVYLNGSSASVCHGILGHVSTITGCTIRAFSANVNVEGIRLSYAWDVCVGNQVYELSAGSTPYVYFGGAVVNGNYGEARTATASSGAATLNAESGTITSEPLSTAVGASYTLTLTNALIDASSQVFVSVQRGGGVDGEADSLSYQVQEVRPAAGSCAIVIKNTGGVPFGDSGTGPGRIKISFKVDN